MIKNLNSMTKSVITANVGKQLLVEEKLDAPFFKLFISNDGVICVKKTNDRELDFVDYTLNSIYKDVMDFAEELSASLKHDSEYEYRIDVFYFPVATPRTISYPEFEHKFVITDLWALNESGDYYKTDYEESYKLLYEAVGDKITKKPYLLMTITDEIISEIDKYTEGVYSELMFINKLFGPSIKSSTILKAEAYIFRVENSVLKVSLNEKRELTDEVERKMSRDIVLKDFTEWFHTNNIRIPTGMTYIDTVSELFLEYINQTDILNKYSLTEKDMTPPFVGFIGTMDTSFISNKIVVTIIENDATRCAIYKILLAALRKHIFKKKNDILTYKNVNDFNEIIEKIEETV